MLTPMEEIRRKLKMRQKDIEEKTKIPQPRYSRIERGVTKPTQEEMGKLVEAFGLKDKDDG